MVSCFTDHYPALDGSKHLVLLVPFYGPMCFNLPSDLDKDRVYENFYLKASEGGGVFVGFYLKVCGFSQQGMHNLLI